ncbi:MAG: PmoA family protein [Planctomycetes bacterium]|nr:PmoA family protein [Planctomycetota bacterium]
MSVASRVLLCLPLCFLVSLSARADDEKSPAGFSTQGSPEGVLVLDSGKKVLFFQQKPKSLDGQYERAGYVHPLWDLDGEVLTEDFPDDHKHHRGIFWTWHQLTVGGKRVGDPWICKDFLSSVRAVKPVLRDDGTARLEVLSHWKSPLWEDENGIQKTIAVEKTGIVIHPVRDCARAIDFAISLHAVEKDVRIGGSEDVKGYGGFCTRLKLPGGP